MQAEPFPVPAWIVMSAGTGGTSATLGRYIRYCRHNTRLCVADPEFSVFYDYYASGNAQLTSQNGSRIEGIGRPRVEPSFLPTVVDRMIKVPDAASLAAIRFLEKLINRKCGGSTGTNLYGALRIISELNQNGSPGCSIVTLICDAGERYLNTYYNDGWLQYKGIDIDPYLQKLWRFWETGVLTESGAPLNVTPDGNLEPGPGPKPKSWAAQR
jgi:cysteine synthase A